MMARKPAARVRAVLELFRPLVDEIVLAADRSGDPDTLDACADLADQRYAADPAPLNRRLGWLHSRCEGDWILHLEDDEVPSAALLARLRGLLEDRQPMQIAFTRRWLWGSDASWIATQPWSLDYQIRLVRNSPGAWRYPGELHAPLEVLGELRLVDAPIYHCELLLADVDARRAKRRQFDRVRRVWNADFPVNCFYTPEDWPGVETAPTPADDLGLISGVRRAVVPARDRSAARAVAAVPAREAERFPATREVSPEAYDASIELVRPPEVVPAGVVRYHEVVVTNLGDERWPWGDYPPHFRLGYRWLTPAGEAVLDGRCFFTETVQPAMTTRVLAPVGAPAEPGLYLLSLDVVHEDVRWFGCETIHAIGVKGGGARARFAERAAAR
jgi:hypothetical protein